ncbi:Uncharacterised protein [Sphingobacterium spiritivorum]|uniref:Uncharacterized protein n=1 Tax=Sphingobacterium spiritivorum ATCC 33861 TaxID=525373 RepID=D7VTM4_SPHSI|nr:hypothetical protein HMPREF0766_14344 [Sphingobacterium spiritivorum ATCC 33861]SUJ29529.1 Uncharacterised protein [Sphingobacterium spiritivorum]
MYVFRKDHGEWLQHYIQPFKADLFYTIKQMLDEIDQEIFHKEWKWKIRG